ncbi:UDP-galactopyranose mutase [Paraglaciecola chathamensis]|uniref:UDP-galactopyranose mutase n=2 Tax=Paraglaciecola chathamensis TaxID=368405 RepID=A0A8H9M3M7_9ALTE|nr:MULTISPECIES: UDP-galactopyranose mutase [Paraglaciecola]MBN28000.1 UDP-galactopyranose mutase [Alteromonadaceae bacterium]GAC11321.1 UDP-galactopyranose mutase [Paraglaciecola chathamensis S18K6]GGZ56496.1 UDP-galactopyranose mutase [Paraglaciecola oceanifecundans]|tara:strand:+ start:97576 stop:98733 length:1158 start_codon:yes stop_codon:yes gene_type:complete
MSDFDVIVVGAGFSGAVMAERFASQQNKKVLVLEQRPHIAGNCYDYTDDSGITVHHYGPHLFHTNKEHVWQYLSQFAKWTPYEHKVLGSIDGKLVPIPFNLNTLHQLFPNVQAQEIESLLIEHYGAGGKVPILELRKSPYTTLQQLAELVYEKFFVNYTTKQWGCSPEDISPEVTARVPIVISRDDRYFHDKYQAIPSQGYTQLIANILNHDNIEVRLNTDATSLIRLIDATKSVEFKGQEFNGKLVFTGMLDQLFDYSDGELPYRSLQFDFQTLDTPEFQPNTTVNYPNEHAYTRITEFKHILKQGSDQTVIVKEYPQYYDRNDPTKNVPYYPIFNQDNQQKFDQYKKRLAYFKNIISAGRLADYKYYNMDDAVGNVLSYFESE